MDAAYSDFVPCLIVFARRLQISAELRVTLDGMGIPVSSTFDPLPDDDDPLEAVTMAPGARTVAPGAAPAAGSVIGDYELLEEVARGGMGVVFRARQCSLNRVVAVKMVLDAVEDNDELQQRFANEAEAAAALDHPGIVPVYEVGQYRGYPYFSMAFVDGRSLADAMSGGPLAPRRAAEIARDVASAIAHAHGAEIIHRDLKPANILIDTHGAPRVTDFGVCKSLRAGSDLTSSGELIGTPHYMPPEQAGGKQQTVSPASDVYSLGAVLYATLTGRPPFQAATPLEVVSQVLSQEPVPPRRLNPSVPVDLEVITLKCLSKSPRDRYGSAGELADDLARFLSGQPIEARPPSMLRRIQFLVRKHVLLSSVSGSAALLLVALTILVAIALVRAQTQVMHLQQLLATQRASAVRFAGGDDDEATRPVQEAFDVQRLNDIAVAIGEENPDLSLKLAIEAVDTALKHGLEVPDAARQMLVAAIGSEATEAEMGSQELLDQAREQVLDPFTDFERASYQVQLDPDE